MRFRYGPERTAVARRPRREIEHFPDDDEMVAAVVDFVGRAFEPGQRSSKSRHARGRHACSMPREQIALRLRKMRRDGAADRQDVDAEMRPAQIGLEDCETLAMFHKTSGGSSETELKLLAVIPQGRPEASLQVTIVMPVAKRPSPSRIVLWSFMLAQL